MVRSFLHLIILILQLNMDLYTPRIAQKELCKLSNSSSRNVKNSHKALLVYHCTPLHDGYLPSELLMNCKIRTPLPIFESQLIPSIPDYNVIHHKETQYKDSNKHNFDSRHHVIPLDPLDSEQPVWIKGRRGSGVITQPAETPRLYVV